MSVYVDSAQEPYCGMLMSHLIADTLPELHAMAHAIGLKPAWFGKLAWAWPHYDVCNSKRARAIQLGAVPVNRGGLTEVIRRIRDSTRCVSRV